MIKKILILTASILIIFLFFYTRVIFQEGNPLPQISGIIRLAFGKNDIVKLSTTGDVYMTKSGNSRDVFIGFMKGKNYEFVEQMGSGYIFISKSQERIIVIHRQYTKYYDLWKMPDGKK